MESVSRILSRAARCDNSVLLIGETGTGKDLAARKIHELSQRNGSPFVAINCSNLSEGLFESELFGHTRGAFTGAVHEKSGLLDIADNGTIFMDEIGELPFHLQAKILRLLDKKESRKIGATQTKIIKARFIFATNKDLYSNVLNGTFRKDLYYRIDVVRIRIPALRERKEDIPELVDHFLGRENFNSGTRKRLAPEALKKLMNHDFPGNIRELENVIGRSFIFSEGDLIRVEDVCFDYELALCSSGAMPKVLENAIEQCHWNKTRTALKLGMSRRQLYRILEKYELAGCVKKRSGAGFPFSSQTRK